MCKILVGAIVAIVIAVFPAFSIAAPTSVVFINPGNPDEPFWRSVTRFMEPAASQLDMQLEVLYADRNHVKMVELMRQVAQRAKKPDFVIIVNEKASGGVMLKLAEQAKIPTLIAFSAFEGDMAREYGTPRQQYHYWLGSIVPNAYEAGRATAAELLRQATSTHPTVDGKLHVAMIAGDRVTPTGVERADGATSVFLNDAQVVFTQTVYGDWERARAYEQVGGLMVRYPKLDVIWCASDLMAFGAIDVAEAAGRKPGKDIFISAFNNSPEVLKERISGRISALAGGHFTAGAWALVMLYDYTHGKDFADQGLQLQLPLFVLLDGELSNRFVQRYGNEDFSKIDFRQFSRHLHPELQHYDFSLLKVLR
jgi:ABC-type sugar transport system substrate-binding protein